MRRSALSFTPVYDGALDAAADHVGYLSSHLPAVIGAVSDVTIARISKPRHIAGVDASCSAIKERANLQFTDVAWASISLAGRIAGTGTGVVVACSDKAAAPFSLGTAVYGAEGDPSHALAMTRQGVNHDWGHEDSLAARRSGSEQRPFSTRCSELKCK